jgi:hypothetical protein
MSIDTSAKQSKTTTRTFEITLPRFYRSIEELTLNLRPGEREVNRGPMDS